MDKEKEKSVLSDGGPRVESRIQKISELNTPYPKVYMRKFVKCFCGAVCWAERDESLGDCEGALFYRQDHKYHYCQKHGSPPEETEQIELSEDVVVLLASCIDVLNRKYGVLSLHLKDVIGKAIWEINKLRDAMTGWSPNTYGWKDGEYIDTSIQDYFDEILAKKP